ncbi:MFS-type transporter SLC18B1-like isoform X2 [Thrips palmi]|uniref:MFS-type transporter SLC18B1-like isoform X2 n=2 Tax=Thrips palmi TaxID=161013 RepID=A0A6P8Y7T1_THRPL|nr:MFS-type transporter SLC18B1-like isoform X2 [Thrips palmi]
MGCLSNVAMRIKRRYTRRQWSTVMLIGTVNFAGAVCISLQAPFYPQEAEMKGSTATEYGLVFGIFELVSFLSSPLFGKYLDTIGAKFTLTSGIFVAAVSCMLFGLLDLVMQHPEFIGLSFAVRIVEALGASAALTAAFAIIASEFPDSVGTTFATLETFYGVGYIVGPTIGGLLFQAGGYILPFIVMGSMLGVVGVVTCVVLPASNQPKKPQASLLKMLAVPGVLLDSLVTTATAMSMGFYSATLEPHLRQFDLSPALVGVMFIISGGIYAVFAPLVGRIIDRCCYAKRVVLLGGLFVIVGVALVGPADFMPVETSLWLCVLGLIIHGLGLSCLMVPTFSDAISSAVCAGFPDDLTTYGVVSGLWAASFALGAFVGPSVAGVLFDTVGFRKSTYFIIAVHVLVVVGTALFLCCERRPPARKPGKPKTNMNGLLRLEESNASSLNLIANWSQDHRNQSFPGVTRNKAGNDYGSIGSTLSVIEVAA